MAPFESLGTVSCSPSIVTVAVSVAVSEIFSVKEWLDLETRVRGHPRSFKMARFDRLYTSSYCCVFSNIMILLEVNVFKKVWNCHILTTVDVLCFHLIVSFRFYRASAAVYAVVSCLYVCLYVCLFVCLSVRPSVTFMDHVKTNKHIVTFFHHR